MLNANSIIPVALIGPHVGGIEAAKRLMGRAQERDPAAIRDSEGLRVDAWATALAPSVLLKLGVPQAVIVRALQRAELRRLR